MAEAIFKFLHGTRVYIDSVGVRTKDIDGYAVTVMDEIGIDLSRHNAKTFDDLEDDENLDFLQDFLVAKGYNKLIPEGLRDKYKREADIEKYLKNMDKLRQRGILS